MIVELVLLGCVFLFYAILKDRKPSRMPPGPAEIPFFGNTLPDTVKSVENYRKTYGDIFTTRLGNTRQICISDYKIGKEVMASSDCADRASMFKIFQIDPESPGGIFSSNGISWLHHRRFVLKHLRDLGMGKSSLEAAIHEEARALVEHLKSLDGKPKFHPFGLRTAVLNVIWQLVASKRYDFDSKEVSAIFSVFENFRDEVSMLAFLEAFFPILKWLPNFIRHMYIKPQVFDKFRSEMKKLIDACIQEHEKTLDETHPRDLIDEYLIDLKRDEVNSENAVTRPVLYEIISDLFAAGSDTVTNMLRWAVFFMVKYPEIAKKCQQEIDREVAGDQLVSLMDKPRLPYVEAFITETFRQSSLVYVNVQRETSKDMAIGGYDVPKGTLVIVNSIHIHHDPAFWDDPEAFKPERFLDSEGKFQASLGRSFAFGSGRRLCIGESLARMEFFLFTSAILQNFTVEKPPGTKLDETLIDTVGDRVTKNQEYIFKYRK